MGRFDRTREVQKSGTANEPSAESKAESQIKGVCPSVKGFSTH